LRQTYPLNRRNALIWRWIAWYRCSALLPNWMDMIEDISQDHPDRMRIVMALNAGQCPDCNAYGFDLKPRVGISRNIFCKVCGQGFNVAPDPPKAHFVQRIGRRSRA
jgi:hypothetical protein